MKDRLITARNEKDVENIFRSELVSAFPDCIMESPFGCDGHLSYDNANVTMLMEFKYNLSMTDRFELCKLLCQCVAYLKKMQDHNGEIPKLLFVGDINECMFFKTSVLEKYLTFPNVNWSIPPCNFHANIDLLKAIVADESICAYTFDITSDDFEFSHVVEKMKEAANGIDRKIKITEHNIDILYKSFVDRVLKQKKIDKKNASNYAGVFLSCLISPNDNYMHPRKKNMLVTTAMGEVHVDSNQFNSFFSYFDKGNYSQTEKNRIASISDRLIEDEARRLQGAFFTPTIWVDEAHKMLDEQLGPNWRNEYVVWDCCCGTGNLTRDYQFKELYCSTIEPAELDIMVQNGYNPEAQAKFVYDFLSEIDIESCPKALRDVFNDEKKKVLFLINPPYKTAAYRYGGNSSTGVCGTRINESMKQLGIGSCSENLYAQFLFKIYWLARLHNCKIDLSIFMPVRFYTSSSFSILRSKMFELYSIHDIFMFEASNFSDVTTGWGISFSLFLDGDRELRKSFRISAKEIDDGYVINRNIVPVYCSEDDLLFWLNSNDESKLNGASPVFSSALNWKNLKSNDNFMGRFCSDPKVYDNINGVYILNSPCSRGGVGIHYNNIMNCISMFSARKMITPNWVIESLTYSIPTTSHPDYKQWNRDAIVYTLFNASCQTSSLRQIECENQKFDIHNKLFWRSPEDMLSLADKYGNSTIYNDVKKFGEKRLLQDLPGITLSDDARSVLTHANQLLDDSFQYRDLIAQSHPEWHINTWDAGWYQIKLLLKEIMPDQFKAFQLEYKQFEARMREGVYKFGFLKQ